MNLHKLLKQREAAGNPIRVGLIGAGRFGTMYLSQALNIPGLRINAVADINLARAEASLDHVGWPMERRADSVEAAIESGGLALVDNSEELFESQLDVIIEATGNPIVGISHALRAIETGKHIVMVTVEADALAGPALSARAEKAGLIYTLAYGDQPAMIWDLVDWARTSGFEVVCAGKGAKYLPTYHDMNPDNVWDFWEFSDELKASGQLNRAMHTSFRDGTKAAIEMAAVANAAGLFPSDHGLTFSPGDLEQIATVCSPKSAGGVLDHEGSVDVMSSLNRDGSWIPHNTQEGVFVVIKATNKYVSDCFGEYPWFPDPSRQYAALYKPYHFVGLELNISIANAVLHGASTGNPIGFFGDVVATAKKDLEVGELLDGEGGFAVWGKLVSAETSVREGYLPVALAHHVPLKRSIPKGELIRWADVEIDPSLSQAIELRKETEALVVKRQGSLAAAL